MKRNTLFAVVLLLCLSAAVALSLLFGGRSEEYDAAYAEAYDIIITELCTKNETVIADNQGRYRDYIELYNQGDAVSLSGLYLTDGKKDSSPFGDVTLAAGEYRLVFLGDDITGFSLSAKGGDSIQLLSASGSILAQTNTATLTEDQVMLFHEGQYTVSYDASPGFANSPEGIRAFREGTAATEPKLLISELLTENAVSLPDEQGRYCDVIELYNASEQELSLSGYCLSDSLSQRFRYRLPDLSLPAGGYLLVYCDGENYISADGKIHSNFGLSYGDILCLTDPMGGYVTAQLSYPGEDISLALDAEGEYVPASVSLGYPNTEEGALAFAQSCVNEDAPLVINELLLQQSGIPYEGKLCDAVEIINRSDAAVSTEGWYLSDGGDPYKFPLPEGELAPGECLVLLCQTGGENSTGFSLSEGETLLLTGPDFRHAQPLTCKLAQEGKSMLRREEQGETVYAPGNISLGYANSEENELRYLEDNLSQGLRISEAMSANVSYLRGAYASRCDWIELYNASDEAIELSEYYLSDDLNKPYAYQLPQGTLAAGEYRVILLSESGDNLPSGYAVLPMTLSSNGDRVYLSRDDQNADYVFLPDLTTDSAYGRPEGSADFRVLAQGTPGKANSGIAEKSEMPVAVTAQGVYDGVEYLDVELSAPGEIHYTMDGSHPTQNSLLYTEPIRISKTTVIRAVCCEAEKATSEILNLTYVINENDVSAVACIVIEPNYLFDENNGLYMQGPRVGPDDEFPYMNANYWWDVERRAEIAIFETDGGGTACKCALKMFGGYSRALAKKSMAIFFRDAYGSGALQYPLFGEAGLDSYESFVFRSCGQDSIKAMMRDPMVTSLVVEYTDVAVQKYKPVALYINGKYWGLYYIREKVNPNYVAGNFNADPEDTILCAANGRSSPEYVDLITYVRNHDLSQQECYDYVCSQVNIDQYMDYIIAEMWICNTDNGNIKFCKTTESKWNWIMYDVDYSFSSYTFNTVSDHLNPSGTGAGNNFSTSLINGLLKNPDFKDAFLKRMAWQMNTIWTEENVIAHIDAFEDMIEEDMVKDCARWYRNYEGWRSDVEELRIFARNRNKYMLLHIQNQFGLTTEQMRSYGFDV